MHPQHDGCVPCLPQGHSKRQMSPAHGVYIRVPSGFVIGLSLVLLSNPSSPAVPGFFLCPSPGLPSPPHSPTQLAGPPSPALRTSDLCVPRFGLKRDRTQLWITSVQKMLMVSSNLDSGLSLHMQNCLHLGYPHRPTDLSPVVGRPPGRWDAKDSLKGAGTLEDSLASRGGINGTMRTGTSPPRSPRRLLGLLASPTR